MRSNMKSFSVCLIFLVLIFAHPSYALLQHGKFWNQATITMPVCDHSKIKFYAEPRLRFIDNKFKLEEVSAYTGLGYQATKNLLLILGVSYIDSSNPGRFTKEYRIFQQTHWEAIHNEQLRLINRTRFEIRKQQGQPQRATRFRERLMARIPVPCWDKHSFVTFEEVFFNFNHPAWVSRKFLAENRLFLGIGIELAKYTNFDIGYMNQFQFNRVNRMNHVIYTNINVTVT